LLAFIILAAGLVAPLPDCIGPNRAERQVTCLVDGDTGWEGGRNWRYEGIDTPEISRPECDRELVLGRIATERLRQLMADGYAVQWLDRSGRYGRELVTITLADGRDAGEVLVEEGLAQRWPNEGNVWCEAP
jgi:micrococcal nuclease